MELAGRKLSDVGAPSDASADADESVEELALTEEEPEDDEAAPRGNAEAASRAKGKRRALESEEDLQESTADEDEDEDDVADDEEEEEEEEEEDEEEDEDKRLDASDSAAMLRMLRALPEEEARRHEQFRRSHFERGAIKRCMAQAIQDASKGERKVPGVTNVMAIVMAGMTKVFVGEITAEARRIMEKNGETGPIRPRHLREAHRRYYRRHPLARGRNLRRLLR